MSKSASSKHEGARTTTAVVQDENPAVTALAMVNTQASLESARAAAANYSSLSGGTRKKSNTYTSSSGNHPRCPSVTAADVLVGRGKGAYMSEGNLRFQKLVCDHLSAYKRALKNRDKIEITNKIVDAVKASGGRFLKEEGVHGQVAEIDDRQARIKVAQALRRRRRIDEHGVDASSSYDPERRMMQKQIQQHQQQRIKQAQDEQQHILLQPHNDHEGFLHNQQEHEAIQRRATAVVAQQQQLQFEAQLAAVNAGMFQPASTNFAMASSQEHCAVQQQLINQIAAARAAAAAQAAAAQHLNVVGGHSATRAASLASFHERPLQRQQLQLDRLELEQAKVAQAAVVAASYHQATTAEAGLLPENGIGQHTNKEIGPYRSQEAHTNAKPEKEILPKTLPPSEPDASFDDSSSQHFSKKLRVHGSKIEGIESFKGSEEKELESDVNDKTRERHEKEKKEVVNQKERNDESDKTFDGNDEPEKEISKIVYEPSAEQTNTTKARRNKKSGRPDEDVLDAGKALFALSSRQNADSEDEEQDTKCDKQDDGNNEQRRSAMTESSLSTGRQPPIKKRKPSTPAQAEESTYMET